MSKLYDGIITGLVVVGLAVALTVKPSPNEQAAMDARGTIVAALSEDRAEAIENDNEDCHCTDTEVGCTDDCLDSAEVEKLTDDYLREAYPND